MQWTEWRSAESKKCPGLITTRMRRLPREESFRVRNQYNHAPRRAMKTTTRTTTLALIMAMLIMAMCTTTWVRLSRLSYLTPHLPVLRILKATQSALHLGSKHYAATTWVHAYLRLDRLTMARPNGFSKDKSTKYGDAQFKTACTTAFSASGASQVLESLRL